MKLLAYMQTSTHTFMDIIKRSDITHLTILYISLCFYMMSYGVYIVVKELLHDVKIKSNIILSDI